MKAKKAASTDRPYNMTEDILSRLSGVRQSGSGYTAKCPAHDDRNASLSVTITESGRLLAHCFAGCSFQEIREALGLAGERFTPSPRPIAEGPTPEQLAAQATAIRIWNGAKPASSKHIYISRKKIQPHHARQNGASLVIPLQNSSGDLWNLQFIRPNGNKRFLEGGLTKGLFTFLGDIRETGRIYLAEGFSTSASINEFTGKPCFVGFSAYNLPIVALTIRRAFPGAEIIIAADADEAGEKYAEEAARTVGGLIVYAGRAN